MTEENKIRPRKELEEALRRINDSTDFKNGHLELSSDERSSSLVRFLKEHFYADEALGKSLGAEFDEEVTAIFSDILRENLSVLLISDSTGEIIACRSMSLAKKGEKADWSKSKNRKFVTIMDFLGHRYDAMDVFKRYNADIAVSFFALATHRDHRAQGIASKLMKATLLFCKELGLNPVFIKGEGTSNYSQKIYGKFGFETIHTLPYDEYKIDGEIVFKNTGENKSTKCYVKQL
ncbi:unnamed protein product [Mytilus coruscus]|uniref:N-acetyltransferase domain-containing protein n=1 Tax=Mytilus coruscus TaxID=42192 RepID=A0A6J8BEC4_MYTCO|nr:unnamed protein product [Mytilus coruscus]